MKILNKNKLLQTLLLLTLFGLLLITPIGKAKGNTEWNLKIITPSGTTINYSYDQILAMPKSSENAALLCFGNLVTSGLWSGVNLGYLLEQVGVDPTVASIDFKAQDGYTASYQALLKSCSYASTLFCHIAAYQKVQFRHNVSLVKNNLRRGKNMAA